MARGLGTGLGALFGDDVLQEESGSVRTAPISKVEPRAGQPRVRFDPDQLEALAESIREHGVLQPITVRPLDAGFYQIIAGERRWRAARLAGLDEVPVNVIRVDDRTAMELALVENLQREDLNPVEEAKGYQTLISEYGLTQEEAARRVGKSRPVVTNALRLLSLPEQVLQMLEEGELSMSHARTLLELDSPALRLEAAEQMRGRQMSVREATALIKRMTRQPRTEKSTVAADGVDYVAEAELKLTKAVGHKVRIVEGRKKGRLEIEYYGSDDFERIYEALLSLGSGKED